jgi:hypothetical protein
MATSRRTGVALGWADHEAAANPHHPTLDVDDTASGLDVDVHVATA